MLCWNRMVAKAFHFITKPVVGFHNMPPPQRNFHPTEYQKDFWYESPIGKNSPYHGPFCHSETVLYHGTVTQNVPLHKKPHDVLENICPTKSSNNVWFKTALIGQSCKSYCALCLRLVESLPLYKQIWILNVKFWFNPFTQHCSTLDFSSYYILVLKTPFVKNHQAHNLILHPPLRCIYVFGKQCYPLHSMLLVSILHKGYILLIAASLKTP